MSYVALSKANTPGTANKQSQRSPAYLMRGKHTHARIHQFTHTYAHMHPPTHTNKHTHKMKKPNEMRHSRQRGQHRAPASTHKQECAPDTGSNNSGNQSTNPWIHDLVASMRDMRNITMQGYSRREQRHPTTDKVVNRGALHGRTVGATPQSAPPAMLRRHHHLQ
jgi:hypothetical protein